MMETQRILNDEFLARPATLDDLEAAGRGYKYPLARVLAIEADRKVRR